MRCKACDCSIEGVTRNVQDETGWVWVMVDDLCSRCINASKERISEEDLRDIYMRQRNEAFRVIR